MGLSQAINVCATNLGNLSGFSYAHRNRRKHLTDEILTFCSVLYRRGTFKFYYDVHQLSPNRVYDLSTGQSGRCYLFRAHVQYIRRAPSALSAMFSTFSDNPPAPNMTPKRNTTVTVLKAEATGLVLRPWEPYQREPRWDIQGELLAKLLDAAEVRMRERFGPNYRAKLLRKAMGDDIALDERHAYATLHTMGGPNGGGEWIHVPPGMDDLPDKMQHPRRDANDWEMYQQWRRVHAEQLQQEMLAEGGFVNEDQANHRLLEDKAMASGGLGPSGSHSPAARDTQASGGPSGQADKKRKDKRQSRPVGHLEPISSNNEASCESDVEEKGEERSEGKA